MSMSYNLIMKVIHEFDKEMCLVIARRCSLDTRFTLNMDLVAKDEARLKRFLDIYSNEEDFQFLVDMVMNAFPYTTFKQIDHMLDVLESKPDLEVAIRFAKAMEDPVMVEKYNSIEKRLGAYDKAVELFDGDDGWYPIGEIINKAD